MAPKPTQIALIGSGTIGLSFAALHLTRDSNCLVTLFDNRPDLQEYVAKHLPGYLTDTDQIACISRLSFADTLETAVKEADIVQEQGPENAEFKVNIWHEIEEHAPQHALFWSSTSGIPASEQNQKMRDKCRLVVVHPYNPPHIMPLLEVVRGPDTSEEVLAQTLEYWRALGRTPVLIQRECRGFVANRLAFALFREACSLVSQGVIGVEDLDEVVRTSMGPRWAVAGPFKAYHAGGGDGGLTSFMDKIGGTVQQCWDASDEGVREGDIRVGGHWQEEVCRQAQEVYGSSTGDVDVAERDSKTKKVLDAVR
jgi:3-hydroxyacyl-CoA dehydrogenase